MKNPKFSKFSLAVIKDSGWYVVYMDRAETIHWGLHEGCEFLEGVLNANAHSEHCHTADNLRCSDDFMFVSRCRTSKYSNTFNLNEDYFKCAEDKRDQTQQSRSSDYFQNFSLESQCQVFTQNGTPSAGCFKTECPLGSASKSYFVVFTKDEKVTQIECTKKDEVVTIDDNHNVICGDPDLVCFNKSPCKANCYSRGRCLENGKCLCNSFYSGDICEFFNDCGPTAVSSKVQHSFFGNDSHHFKTGSTTESICTWVKTFNKIDERKLPSIAEPLKPTDDPRATQDSNKLQQAFLVIVLLLFVLSS